MRITILHVEDDPVLAQLVRMAFNAFGFRGDMLAADGVESALALLAGRARNHEPVDLIVVDMELPDGTGLDVVREVRADPVWHLTPVLVLSGETEPGTVNEAYALGANCYLPKSGKPMLSSLRALFDCWTEYAVLPREHPTDRVREILSRSIHLRTRTSEIFLSLADAATDPAEMTFWLERAMSEGNLANLLALFRRKIAERDIPLEVVQRVTKMQDAVEKTLRNAEKRLKGALDLKQICDLALDLLEAVDEETFVEGLGYLFRKSPQTTIALRERAATHLRELASHILERAEDPELRRRAEALCDRARRTAAPLRSEPQAARNAPGR